MRQTGETMRFGPIQFSLGDIVRYAGASDDYNPIHHDQERAQAFGLPGVIAHGMLSMGALARVLAEAAPPGFQLQRLGVRFRAMVEPNDPLTAVIQVRSYGQDGTVEVDLGLNHADGRAALSGTAVLRIPPQGGDTR